MNTASNLYKLRLGIFVLIGFLLFIYTIFLIGKQKNLFDPVYKLNAQFSNVSGLIVGNNVRFSGINIGTIDYLKITNDSTVLVEMLIRKNVEQFIKNDCKVSISSEGIIGDRILVIHQGSKDTAQAKEGKLLATIEPVEAADIITSLHVSSLNTEIITDQLAEVMIKINRGHGTLGRLLQDKSLAENINQTMINLKKSSQGLNENMEAAKSNFFLKGYFKKKEKTAQREKEEKESKKKSKTKIDNDKK